VDWDYQRREAARAVGSPVRQALARNAALDASTGAALNGADLAATAMRVLSRPTAHDDEVVKATLTALIEAFRATYDECRKHALEDEACRICGDVCRRCAHACRQILRLLGG
jgi:hypothetical protein